MNTDDDRRANAALAKALPNTTSLELMDCRSNLEVLASTATLLVNF